MSLLSNSGKELENESLWNEKSGHGNLTKKQRTNQEKQSFWDNADHLVLFKPSPTEIKSLTYSSYCGGNVEKGGKDGWET